jgi:SAM-dependent methyltransferase
VEPKLQRWVQRHGWDRAVSHYDEHWREQLRPAHTAVLELAALAPGESVVEVSCGTGMVTLPAAVAVGAEGRVLATDISGQMVDDTARRAREWGLDHVETLRCDAEALSIALSPTDAFDVALCSLGLMYVPSPPAAMVELVAALRPGGRMVAAVWGERRNCGWASIFPIVDSRVESDVCPLFFALGGPGSLAGLAERAGLVDVEQRRITCELVYADEDSALAAAFLGGPVALAYSRFDADTKASASADYLASIAPFRHGSGYRIPGEFVVVAARRPESIAGASNIATDYRRQHITQLEDQPT